MINGDVTYEEACDEVYDGVLCESQNVVQTLAPSSAQLQQRKMNDKQFGPRWPQENTHRH